MPNRFRDPVMRNAYDEAIAAHQRTSRVLFVEGRPHRGNGVAGPFWRGYSGEQEGRWDAASRKTLSYAYWCAGRDIRQAELAEKTENATH